MKSVSERFHRASMANSQHPICELVLGRIDSNDHFVAERTLGSESIQRVSVSGAIGESGKIGFGSVEAAQLNASVLASDVDVMREIVDRWMQVRMGYHVPSSDFAASQFIETAYLTSPAGKVRVSYYNGKLSLTKTWSSVDMPDVVDGVLVLSEPELIDMGTFMVETESVARDGLFIKMTAYDRLYWLDTPPSDTLAKGFVMWGSDKVTEDSGGIRSDQMGKLGYAGIARELENLVHTEFFKGKTVDLSISHVGMPMTMSGNAPGMVRGTLRDSIAQLGEMSSANAVMDGYNSIKLVYPRSAKFEGEVIKVPRRLMDSRLRKDLIDSVLRQIAIIADYELKMNNWDEESGEYTNNLTFLLNVGEWVSTTGSYMYKPNQVGATAIVYDNPDWLDFSDLWGENVRLRSRYAKSIAKNWAADYNQEIKRLIAADGWKNGVFDGALAYLEDSTFAYKDRDNHGKVITPYKYTGFDVTVKGLPQIELGDFFLAEDQDGDVNCLVLRAQWTYDGGISCTFGADTASFDYNENHIDADGNVRRKR